MRIDRDEAFALEHPESFPQRRPADVELGGELFLVVTAYPAESAPV